MEAVEDLNLVSQYLSKSLHLTTSTIIGHSKGGEIALLYAQLYPSLLRQVIAINVHFDLGRNDECQLTPVQTRGLQMQGYVLWKRYGPRNTRFFVIRKEDVRLRASVNMRGVEKISSHVGILILHGDADEIIPFSEAKKYGDLLSDRRNLSVKALKGVGHWLVESDVEQVSGAINAWIRDDLSGVVTSKPVDFSPIPITSVPSVYSATPPKFPGELNKDQGREKRFEEGIQMSPALLAEFLAAPDEFDLDTGLKKKNLSGKSPAQFQISP